MNNSFIRYSLLLLIVLLGTTALQASSSLFEEKPEFDPFVVVMPFKFTNGQLKYTVNLSDDGIYKIKLEFLGDEDGDNNESNDDTSGSSETVELNEITKSLANEDSVKASNQINLAEDEDSIAKALLVSITETYDSIMSVTDSLHDVSFVASATVGIVRITGIVDDINTAIKDSTEAAIQYKSSNELLTFISKAKTTVNEYSEKSAEALKIAVEAVKIINNYNVKVDSILVLKVSADVHKENMKSLISLKSKVNAANSSTSKASKYVNLVKEKSIAAVADFNAYVAKNKADDIKKSLVELLKEIAPPAIPSQELKDQAVALTLLDAELTSKAEAAAKKAKEANDVVALSTNPEIKKEIGNSGKKTEFQIWPLDEDDFNAAMSINLDKLYNKLNKSEKDDNKNVDGWNEWHDNKVKELFIATKYHIFFSSGETIAGELDLRKNIPLRSYNGIKVQKNMLTSLLNGNASMRAKTTKEIIDSSMINDVFILYTKTYLSKINGVKKANVFYSAGMDDNSLKLIKLNAIIKSDLESISKLKRILKNVKEKNFDDEQKNAKNETINVLDELKSDYDSLAGEIKVLKELNKISTIKQLIIDFEEGLKRNQEKLKKLESTIDKGIIGYMDKRDSEFNNTHIEVNYNAAYNFNDSIDINSLFKLVKGRLEIRPKKRSFKNKRMNKGRVLNEILKASNYINKLEEGNANNEEWFQDIIRYLNQANVYLYTLKQRKSFKKKTENYIELIYTPINERIKKVYNEYQRNNSGDEYSLEITDGEIEFRDGYIENIIIIGDAPGVDNLVFENDYPIGFSSVREYKKLSNISERKQIRIYDRSSQYYFNFSDIFKPGYIQKLGVNRRDYSPGNQVVDLTPDDKLELKQTLNKLDTENLFQFNIFGDFIGFDEDEPNGLIQTEIEKLFVLRTWRRQWRNFFNTEKKINSGYLNYIIPKISVSKIENQNRRLDINSDPVFINGDTIKQFYTTNMDLISHETFSISTDLNLLLLDMPSFKSTFYFDVGMKWALTPYRDSVASVTNTTDNTVEILYNEDVFNSLSWYPKLTWRVFADERYGFKMSNAFMINYLMSDVPLTKDKEKFVNERHLGNGFRRTYNLFEINAFFNLGVGKSFFFRYKFNSQIGNRSDNHHQAQIGYSQTFSKKR